MGLRFGFGFAGRRSTCAPQSTSLLCRKKLAVCRPVVCAWLAIG